MARRSKKLVEDKGILSLPDPVRRHSLLPETVDFVCAFYESDGISRVMPGKKDFVSVKKGRRASAHSKATGSEQLERGVPRVQGEISRSKNRILKIC